MSDNVVNNIGEILKKNAKKVCIRKVGMVRLYFLKQKRRNEKEKN